MSLLTERWHANRAGLFNFWYYDEDVFEFSGGKLLLRGSNGSGKSVTMQSLIPVLLDGRKSPDRLDPFGSRARRMEDYLLGEHEVLDLDERTGYLYLEFKRGKNQYLTIGMGLKAKRQTRLDFWGFVLWDNRRIGRDLLLYKTEANAAGGQEKIPIGRKELENRLGEGGKVVRTQEEYMSLVNRYLFGFKSLEEFNDLMKLLIQVRSPKLSKDFRPTVIYEILNESLPALADEELRPLSETIENMDQTKSQLDQLVREESAVGRLGKVYTAYNQKVRWEKAQGLVQAGRWQGESVRKLAEEQNAHAQGEADLSRIAREERELKEEKEVLEREEEALKKHDVFKAEEEKTELEAKLREVQAETDKKTHQLEAKQKKEHELQESIQGTEGKLDKAEAALGKNLDEMDDLGEATAFLNHEVAASEFRAAQGSFSFALWHKEAKDYADKIEAALEAFRSEGRAKEKHAEADRELGEARLVWDNTRHAEQKCAEGLTEERKNWLNAFFAWQEGNQELKLQDVIMQTVAGRIWHCPEESGWESLKEPVAEAKEAIRQSLGTELVRQKHALEQKGEEIAGVSAELEGWRRKKEPEPPRHPATEEARRLLAKEKVPFVPFYAGVEFREQVTPETRERLEAALTEAGILDALIVPSAALSVAGALSQGGAEGQGAFPENDRILRPVPQVLAHTLADYLYPTPVEGQGVGAEAIDEVLRSVFVGDTPETPGETGVSLRGGYRIGLVEGQAPAREGSIYIGKEARSRYRRQEIERLERELARLGEEKAGLLAEKEYLEQRLRQVEEEYRGFPAERGLWQAYDRLDVARRDVRQSEKEVAKKDLRLKEALTAWETAKAVLREQTRLITLPLRQEAYESAHLDFKAYRELLRQIELGYQQVLSDRSALQLYRENLDDVSFEVDELKGEIYSLDGKASLMNKELAAVARRLQDLGAEEIRARVAEVIKRLHELPSILEANRESYHALKSEQSLRLARIERLEKDGQKAQLLAQAWAGVFKEEEILQQAFQPRQEGVRGKVSDGLREKEPDEIRGRVPLDETEVGDEVGVPVGVRDQVSGEVPGVVPDEIPDEISLLLKRASRVLSRVRAEKAGSNLDRETLHGRLQQAVFQEMGGLMEYRLAQQSVGELPDSLVPRFAESDQDSLWLSRWEDLRNKAHRTQLVLEYDGKKVSPYYVLARMAQEISLQEQILSERDRELYEEIIMNSVGRIIRARIERAEHWVEVMNSLMGERDTSSGLKLGIRWKARTAEHEDELDTKDLVDLLKADPRLLKEDDMNRITTHFRQKIERAKEALEQKGFGESLHQVIKEMLDYRKWFAFSLLYRKDAGIWKELTDRAFYTFSGGEKAMAMYIPLFSAAYSRYSDARPDAPRLISLDEAFAGVDENNVRDMFDLVEKLGFDYIMNSQALWGDYDTVSRLSVVELVRPKNASFVTLIRYLWDGKVRHLVTGEA